MAAEHNSIKILSADPAGGGIIIHFSDGTITLFQTHFLYQVREDDGNIALTEMSHEDLMKGFGGQGGCST